MPKPCAVGAPGVAAARRCGGSRERQRRERDVARKDERELAQDRSQAIRGDNRARPPASSGASCPSPRAAGRSASGRSARGSEPASAQRAARAPGAPWSASACSAFDLAVCDVMKPRPSAMRTITPSAEPTTTAGSSWRKLFAFGAAREKVDCAHQSSIPSPIATASEPNCSVLAKRFAIFTRERIADANVHADSRSSSSASPGRCAVPPVSNDLADAKAAGLVLVELKRGDELARERLQLSPNCVERERRLLRRQVLRGRAAVEREAALDRLDLGRSAVERASERDVQRRAAPLERPA